MDRNDHQNELVELGSVSRDTQGDGAIPVETSGLLPKTGLSPE